MHFSALRGLTQPCLTAYCILHITYDPGISPGSANQCILGDMYLRSNLSRKLVLASLLSCTFNLLAVAKSHATCVFELTYAMKQGLLCFSSQVLLPRPIAAMQHVQWPTTCVAC